MARIFLIIALLAVLTIARSLYAQSQQLPTLPSGGQLSVEIGPATTPDGTPLGGVAWICGQDSQGIADTYGEWEYDSGLGAYSAWFDVGDSYEINVRYYQDGSWKVILFKGRKVILSCPLSY